ncbi:hypothetical protein BJ742DRAFT_834820 [Cladochytrium replicatum]|nr:hypothetical protein BJ742DRAFT_834820 [Cladochytrium replicatum]
MEQPEHRLEGTMVENIGERTEPLTVEELESRLTQDPRQYHLHLQLLQSLKAEGENTALEIARVRFNQHFPLSPDFWIEWINEKIEAAVMPASKNEVLGLFAKAVADYQDPRIWRSYLRYVTRQYLGCHKLLDEDEGKEHESDEEDEEDLMELDDPSAKVWSHTPKDHFGNPWIELSKVRAICEAALLAVGLHYTDGRVVWSVYKYFELLLLEKQPGDRAAQLDRVRQMFLKRLEIPHEGIEETFSELSSFVTRFENEHYEERMSASQIVYNKTQQEMVKLEPFESRLRQNGYLLTDFLEYAWKMAASKPIDRFRVRSIYERAILVHPTDSFLWDSYITFLLEHMKVASVVLPIIERSVRNCSWSGDVWAQYLRTLEIIGKPRTDIDVAFSQARKALDTNIDELVKAMLAHVDYFCRRVVAEDTQTLEDARKTFRKHIHANAKAFPTGDLYLRLEKAQIRFEALVAKDLDQFNQLYEELLRAQPTRSDLYLEFIQLERILGSDAKKIRALFKRAFTTSHGGLDYPDAVLEAWMTFERDVGGGAVGVVEARGLALANSTLQLQQPAQSLNGSFSGVYRRAKGKPTKGKGAKGKEKGTDKKADSKKRGRGTEPGDEDGGDVSGKKKARKRDVAIEVGNASAAAAAAGVDAEGMDVDQPEIESGSHGNEKGNGSRARSEEAESTESYIVLDRAMAGHMVRVTGLSDDVNDELLRALFMECGDIVDAEVKVEDNGSRVALIEFKDVNGAKLAMQVMNNFELAEDVVLQVQRCKPRKMVWNFHGAEEKSKLFVKGLALDVEQKTLRELFAQHGEVRDVRVVRKGERAFAYIEMFNEEAAQSALVLDGTELSGRKIGVFISDPKRGRESQAAAEKANATTTELVVTQLPEGCDADRLRPLFAQYPGLLDIRVPNAGSEAGSRPRKAIAFVEFETAEQARSALAVNGTKLDEHYLGVTIAERSRKNAVPPPNFSSRARGRRGRGRGRNAGEGERIMDEEGGHWGQGNGRGGRRGRAGLGYGRGLGGGSRGGRGARALVPALTPAEGAQKTGEEGKDSGVKPKSQDDFRKMLLGGK